MSLDDAMRKAGLVESLRKYAENFRGHGLNVQQNRKVWAFYCFSGGQSEIAEQNVALPMEWLAVLL